MSNPFVQVALRLINRTPIGQAKNRLVHFPIQPQLRFLVFSLDALNRKFGIPKLWVLLAKLASDIGDVLSNPRASCTAFPVLRFPGFGMAAAVFKAPAIQCVSHG